MAEKNAVNIRMGYGCFLLCILLLILGMVAMGILAFILIS